MKIDLDTQPVPALARGLAIIEYLSGFPQGKTQKEIVDSLSFPAASVSRITLQLENTGFLWRDPVTKAFRLSMKLLTISQRALFDVNLLEFTLPVMRTLRDRFLDTVILGVLHETEVIAIDSIPGKRLFRFSLDPGHRSELHTSAPGKAILAYLPQSELNTLLKRIKFTRYNEHTITNVQDFRAELEDVRRTGFARDRGEAYRGIYCVGAPILDRNGYPIAAIWTTGPSDDIGEQDIQLFGAAFRDASLTISNRLGFVHGPSEK